MVKAKLRHVCASHSLSQAKPWWVLLTSP